MLPVVQGEIILFLVISNHALHRQPGKDWPPLLQYQGMPKPPNTSMHFTKRGRIGLKMDTTTPICNNILIPMSVSDSSCPTVYL